MNSAYTVTQKDREDDLLVDFFLRWSVFGGGPEEDILVSFEISKQKVRGSPLQTRLQLPYPQVSPRCERTDPHVLLVAPRTTTYRCSVAAAGHLTVNGGISRTFGDPIHAT
ncbi:hypothetical protein BKP42_63190 [Rhodococcus erythropolis]|nr:hypothetical protein BKP42_63190 [Rhodococcus erythropolis]